MIVFSSSLMNTRPTFLHQTQRESFFLRLHIFAPIGDDASYGVPFGVPHGGHLPPSLSRISQFIMAKTTSRPAAGIDSLLTSAEKKVLDGTLAASLAAATRAQLQAARKQARSLRDKWRDLFSRQTISTKRTPDRSRDQSNTRSKEKADLFGDAVKRIEARLLELVEGVSAAVKGTKPAAKAKAKPKASPAASKAATAESKQAAAAGSVSQGKKRPTKPTISKKSRQAGKRHALAASGTGQAISFDVKKQRSANTEAKAALIKFDGQSTRRKGFVVAKTKRKQARRDSR